MDLSLYMSNSLLHLGFVILFPFKEVRRLEKVVKSQSASVIIMQIGSPGKGAPHLTKKNLIITS